MTDTEKISHTLELAAPPDVVYDALLSSEKHTEFTGAPAEFQSKEGGEFSTFNGMITGELKKLEKNRKIIMDWRAKGFPEGYYTKVIFDLTKSKTGTKLSFSHTGVPGDAVQMINEGWRRNYWEKLPEYLG